MTLTLARATWLTPAGRSAVLAYRENTSDWNTVSSIMAPHDEYSLPFGLSGTAVDAGAHIGAATIALALDNPELRVVAIEPVPPNVELLRENVAANGLTERVTILPAAIGGSSDETVTVWYGYRGNETVEHHAYIGNSTLAYDGPNEWPHETVEAEAVSLRSLTADGEITFLKVDTEGGEWAFLDSPAVTKVREIVGEWHPVRGRTARDIVDLLAPTHDVTLVGSLEGPGGFRAVRR